MTPEKIDELLRLISEEGKSLRDAVKIMAIPYTTAWRAVNAPEYADQYARAREERGIFLAEQALEIADNPDIPADHKRLMLDQRKWYSSKLNRKALGDKVDLNHGGQADNPLTVIERRIVKNTQPDVETD